MGAAQAIGASIDAYDQYKRFLDKGDDEYVQHLEEGSRFWIRLAKTTVNPRLKAPSTKVKNVNPKERLHADLVSVGDLSLPFSELDEDFPEGYDGIDELTKVVKAAIFAHGKKLKMGEGDTGFFSSIEVGRQAAQHELGKILPPSPNNWTDFASDEACSRLAFYAIGQLHLTGIVDSDKTVCQLPEETVCKVDLAFLHKYSTRTGFERYGCIAYFSVTKKLLGIYWCSGNRLVQPGHSDWEHVKYVYRSSLMAGVTIWDHLVNVHWIISNNVVYAIRENLSANHSLRRLLKPHTFETVSVSCCYCYFYCLYKLLQRIEMLILTVTTTELFASCLFSLLSILLQLQLLNALQIISIIVTTIMTSPDMGSLSTGSTGTAKGLAATAAISITAPPFNTDSSYDNFNDTLFNIDQSCFAVYSASYQRLSL